MLHFKSFSNTDQFVPISFQIRSNFVPNYITNFNSMRKSQYILTIFFCICKIRNTGKIPITDKIPNTDKIPSTDKIPITDKIPNTDKIPKTDTIPNTDKITITDKIPNADKISNIVKIPITISIWDFAELQGTITSI